MTKTMDWVVVVIAVTFCFFGTFAYIAVAASLFGPPETIIGLFAFTFPAAFGMTGLIAKFVGKISS